MFEMITEKVDVVKVQIEGSGEFLCVRIGRSRSPSLDCEVFHLTVRTLRNLGCGTRLLAYKNGESMLRHGHG